MRRVMIAEIMTKRGGRRTIHVCIRKPCFGGNLMKYSFKRKEITECCQKHELHKLNSGIPLFGKFKISEYLFPHDLISLFYR